MSDQPEALFLADVIENDPQSKAHHDAAAAELRRLHHNNQVLTEALDRIACFAPGYGSACEIIAEVARAAIAKAGGNDD